MKAAPPKLPRARSGSKCAVIFLTVSFALIAATVFFFDPARHTFYPVCQFHRLTGLNCPGCGMTRALYALLHGDLLTALHDNALFVLGIFAVATRGLWFAVKKPATEFFRVKFLWPSLLAALVFTGLRNLPAFAFLSP